MPLLLAWTCKSEEFGVITLDEWLNLKDLRCVRRAVQSDGMWMRSPRSDGFLFFVRVDTPRKLQIAMDNLLRSLYSSANIPSAPATLNKKKGKKPAPQPEPEPEPVQAIDVERKAAEARQKFKEFYMFCFTLMKNS